MADHLIEKNVKHVFALLKEFRFFEAMNLYFHEQVVIQEANDVPIFGKPNCIISRLNFIASSLGKIRHYRIVNFAVSGNHSFYEAIADFKNKDGSISIFEQAVATKWRDGKILKERYYYSANNRKSDSLNMLKKDSKQEVSK